MKAFMDENFLLTTETARTLYHDYAAKMPIVDYHCHINPAEIAEDRRFDTITQAWLGGDHYKWRAMRSNGVPEECITGSASDREKFDAWAATMPKLIGNPLYHWTHLELKRYFGVDKPLSPATADEIWEICNKKFQEPGMTVRGIIEQSGVTAIGTTDDPVDDLRWHKAIAADPTCKVKVAPSFRPDKVLNIEKPEFVDYIKKLGEVAGIEIMCFHCLTEALKSRVAYFAENGCKASDHGIGKIVCVPTTPAEASVILKKRLAGEPITEREADGFRTAVFLMLAEEYVKHDIVMQIHFGAGRNNNTKMFKKLGPDTGYDTIASYSCGEGLPELLDQMEMRDILPKTVIYSLSPCDSEMIGTVIGAFQGEGIGCKVQLGAGWWFNDTKTGMIKQLTDYANLSVLGNFIGMLTDSRSFLSYTRHEYFRRILCELIGGWVENGEYPADMETLGKMVQDISYNNTMAYFGF
ncbi:MAG: glucuronate isomerase [Oscillospiraceae bacterium]|nr:glucuronate isomerase [Oscillospiraceae bacterium]